MHDFKSFMLKCAVELFPGLFEGVDTDCDPFGAAKAKLLSEEVRRTQELNEAKEEVRRLKALSLQEATTAARAAHREACDSVEAANSEFEEKLFKLLQLDGQVEAWQPPNNDGKALKKYALAAIRKESSGIGGQPVPTEEGPGTWLNLKLKYALDRVNACGQQLLAAKNMLAQWGPVLQEIESSINEAAGNVPGPQTGLTLSSPSDD